MFLAELQWLSTHGMVVNTPDNLSIRLRAHCLVAGGDIPAVFDWSRCAYHSSEYGCRICYSKGAHPENKPQGLYFPDTDAAMRTREDYMEANSSLGYNGVSLFTQFSTFSGPQMFSLEELHLLCRGFSSQILQLLTVDLSTSNTKFYHKYEDGAFEVREYPFYIPKHVLKDFASKLKKPDTLFPLLLMEPFKILFKK
ncbi:hypothetical protein [Parasitella parasitica]|uniref:Uncharacterized protein n=1 Tax=Parasitella parasitica TaxID=35722 RepID=A0A0B7NLJ4_9FUNG|nr:hypothetical protein [Parasitella parasitica]